MICEGLTRSFFCLLRLLQKIVGAMQNLFSVVLLPLLASLGLALEPFAILFISAGTTAPFFQMLLSLFWVCYRSGKQECRDLRLAQLQ